MRSRTSPCPLSERAAEPTYVLVDSAIVVHLGTSQLAALAIAATLLSTGLTLFNCAS